EIEVRALHVDEQPALQIAAVREPRADAAVRRRPARVVQLADLRIVAVFGEVAGAEEPLDAIGGRKLQLPGDVLVLDVRIVVDGTALDRLDDRETVGVQYAAFDRGRNAVPPIAAEEIEFGTVVVA